MLPLYSKNSPMSHYWRSGLQETERGEFSPLKRSGSEGETEKATSRKNHPSFFGWRLGRWLGWQARTLLLLGLMVSFWSPISDPCYMNSPQMEFIAPHWFLLAPLLHRSCLYLLEVWCILKQNEPDFPNCLCQCLVRGNVNSFTARLLTIVMDPSYGGRHKETLTQNWKRFFKHKACFKAKGR